MCSPIQRVARRLREEGHDAYPATLTGLGLHNPARQTLPKVAILCSFSLEEVRAIIASRNPLFREMASPKWRFVEPPTGHYPMFSRPEDLAGVLRDVRSHAFTRED